jgi:glyoxylase-like metal-dependent hydrolase (beta-lactamase superfamily II)
MTGAESDQAVAVAAEQVRRSGHGEASRPEVMTFFDEPTFTASHVVFDPAAKAAAIVDSVLDFDEKSGRTSTRSADRMVDFVRGRGLTVEWHLETHAHADHLSAAPYLQEKLGGKLGIGRGITTVQEVFGKVFNEGTEFRRDGSQFDRLFDDGDSFAIGGVAGIALHVPGHTPADVAYVIGDAAFVGDTMFMPDYGTARCDFPGGDARQLYRSMRRILSLPPETLLFMCHDYKAPGRDAFAWETSVGEQLAGNVHIGGGVDEDAYVAMRETRDATLKAPKLLYPAIQVNIRGGRLPPPDEQGRRYLMIPLTL